MNTTYVYEFVNETVEIEISEEWAAILREMDREEMLSDRRETRRHTSLEISNEYSGWLLDYRMDPLEILIRNETEREIELIANEILPERQLEAFRLVILNGYSVKEMAELMGIRYQSALELLDKSKARMLEYKDILEDF